MKLQKQKITKINDLSSALLKTCLLHLKNELAIQEKNFNRKIGSPRSKPFLISSGDTIDKTITPEGHCNNTALMLSVLMDLLGKLTSASWGSNPKISRTKVVALSYSKAENLCSVLSLSHNSRKGNNELEDFCQFKIECFKTTFKKKKKWQKLASISRRNWKEKIAPQIGNGFKRTITDKLFQEQIGARDTAVPAKHP